MRLCVLGGGGLIRGDKYPVQNGCHVSPTWAHHILICPSTRILSQHSARDYAFVAISMDLTGLPKVVVLLFCKNGVPDLSVQSEHP